MSPIAQRYFPAADPASWATVDAAESGISAAKLEQTVALAVAGESSWPRSFYYPDGRYVGIVEWNEKGPWSAVTGPVRPRGGPAGLVLKGGRIVAEWGDTRATDMTFSVAKSYLAILAGIAVSDGLIGSVDDPVYATVRDPLLESAHNRLITWRHLLQQSSEWQGELWGKSDQVDHNRQIGVGADNSRKGDLRALQPPGTFYEYNDVRVNMLAYCLLQRFQRALPEVLKERIMDPIGASQTWEWHGYSNSFVEVAGKRVQSVSGGAHWGGGLFISARDHARVGLLIAEQGRWAGRELLAADWVAKMLSPSPTNDAYGYLWWLNRGAGRHASAPESAVFALGAGNNIIFVDREDDMVCVLRWIDKSAFGGVIQSLMAACGRG